MSFLYLNKGKIFYLKYNFLIKLVVIKTLYNEILLSI